MLSLLSARSSDPITGRSLVVNESSVRDGVTSECVTSSATRPKHLHGRLREDVAGLEQRLEVREYGRPAARDPVEHRLVGQILVGHGETHDVAVWLDEKRHHRRSSWRLV